MQIEKIRIVVVVGSLLGICGLYGYSLSLQPERVLMKELPEHDGEYVITQGWVLECSLQNGDLRLTLNDENTTAVAFVEGMHTGGKEGEKDQIAAGDRVEVLGKVFASNSGYAITVSGRSSVRILEKWDGKIVTLPGLAADPWPYRDRNVNVSCRIRTPITDREGYSYAVIEDDHLVNYSVPLFTYGLSVQRLYRGAEIFLNARFEYQESSLSFRFIMDSNDHHFWLRQNEISDTDHD